MHSFEELAKKFNESFNKNHFPEKPETLYGAGEYFLKLGGKRIRPAMCLMGNELFDEINPDSYHLATAIELFHNFTLIHDDIMDAAPLRRGLQTVHAKFGENTALLAGDVMLVAAYENLNKINSALIKRIVNMFNKTAKEVCEGQQLDMDYEKTEDVTMDAYLQMIELKTSVLLAASLHMGGIMGGAGEGNCNLLYEFGKNLGIAFQIQDDYLDAFGDPEKFGKNVGGDIRQNKKTFLLIYALAASTSENKDRLKTLITEKNSSDEKVSEVLKIYRDCNVDIWAKELKEKYISQAMQNLEDIAVLSVRKQPLKALSNYLIQRDY